MIHKHAHFMMALLRRLFLILCAALAPLAAPAASPSCAPVSVDPVTGSYASLPAGLLWQMTDRETGERDYIVGTVHTAHPAALETLAALEPYWKSISTVALELDLSDPRTQLGLQQAAMLPPDQNLKTLLTPGLYERTIEIMKHYGIPAIIADRLKPWAIATMMSMPPEVVHQPEPLDMRITRQAGSRAKTVLGLETTAEQIAIFDGLSPYHQRILLSDAIAQFANVTTFYNELMRLYAARDLEALRDYSLELMGKMEASSLADELEKSLLLKRNAIMVTRALPLLEQEKLLIAVGALHLPGEEGLLHALEKKGYCLTPLY